jgi:glycosyltransferase involved in cell wall biosynthesis
MKLISVVIPFFNEEKSIPILRDRLQKVALTLDHEFEFVLVDDGSIDQTGQELRGWRTRDDRVVIVTLSRNWGQQSAFNAGLDVARGDAVILMDGDLEDPPELISELTAHWDQGAEIVFTTKSRRYQKWPRRLLTKFYYFLLRTTVRHGADAQAGVFSLLDKQVADVLRGMKERNKSYPNLRSMVGFRQQRVTYERNERLDGEPRQTLRKLIGDGLNALFSNTYVPIRFVTVTGVVLILVSIVAGTGVIFSRITGIEFWMFSAKPGTQMIIIVILAFGALQIIFLGVIGEYIARIYDESKARPYYVIKSIEGDNNN